MYIAFKGNANYLTTNDAPQVALLLPSSKVVLYWSCKPFFLEIAELIASLKLLNWVFVRINAAVARSPAYWFIAPKAAAKASLAFAWVFEAALTAAICEAE